MKKRQIGGFPSVNFLRALSTAWALSFAPNSSLRSGEDPANAQVNAAISGKVEDASGAGVRGATVTVKSVETGAVRSTMTDQNGNFTVLSLPLGAQEVKAEKTGFKAALRTGVNLTVGEDAVVNLQARSGRACATGHGFGRRARW